MTKRRTVTPERPPVESDYAAELVAACPPELWRRVCATAAAQAVAGNSSARAWLAQYLVGLPQHIAPTPRTVAVERLAGPADLNAEAKSLRNARELSARLDNMLGAGDADGSDRA